MATPALDEFPSVARAMRRIHNESAKYGNKLDLRMASMDAAFFTRAEHFWTRFGKFLEDKGKDLEYGVDCHLKLCAAMVGERMTFLREGRYASSSFEEVEHRVYGNPEIMEYYMYGLVFSQFLWAEQYARLEFFLNGLPRYRDTTGSYLEIGGGHAMYVASAAELLNPGTRFELVDISKTSIDVARAMSPADRIDFHLCDIFDYPDNRKFDMIVAGEILEHLEDPRKLLRKIRQLLTADGRAFISTPVNAPTVDHIYLFNDADEIREMLRSEGFTIESETAKYAEDMPDDRAVRLKIARMFAAFVRPGPD